MRPSKTLNRISWVMRVTLLAGIQLNRGRVKRGRDFISCCDAVASGGPGHLADRVLEGPGSIRALDDRGHLEEVVGRVSLALGMAHEQVGDELVLAGAEERLVRHQAHFRG